jgi:hypothetical protein
LLWLLDPDIGLLVILILPPESGPEHISSTGCEGLSINCKRKDRMFAIIAGAHR